MEPNSVNTGGGANVGRDVDTGGGDFSGRDTTRIQGDKPTFIQVQADNVTIQTGELNTDNHSPNIKSEDSQPNEPNTLGREEQLSEEQLNLIEQLKAKLRAVDRGKFVLLVVGQTGVGKSSTINSLMGKIVSPVDPYQRVTAGVNYYEGEIHGIGYTIVDTPGLGDSEKSKQTDRAYLYEIRRRTPKIDCMLFVMRLDFTRVDSVGIKTIHRISDIFDPTVWDRAIIVFTFADKVRPQKFEENLQMRSRLIKDEIAKHSGELLARNIPVVAVANDEDTHLPIPLPNGQSWLGALYTEVFLRISKEGALPFYLATINRVVELDKRSKHSWNNDEIPIPLDESQRKRVSERAKELSFPEMVGKLFDDFVEVGGRIINEVGNAFSRLFGWQ